MVGQQILNLLIGVQVPAPEQDHPWWMVRRGETGGIKMKGELLLYSFLVVFGCVIGCLVSLAYVEDTNRKRNQERLDEVNVELSRYWDKNMNCEKARTATQEELKVANQLITQQGAAVMNCLMLRDPSLDSLLLAEPLPISPPPLAPSP